MNIRTLTLVLGAAVTVAAGGLAATACSSSSNNPGGGGNTDASTNHDTGTGGGNEGGNPGDDGGMAMDDGGGGGVDCGTTPTLHAGDGGTIYCPFGPDGSAIDCPTATTYCCVGGEISKGNYAVSKCQTVGQTCDNPLPDAGIHPGRPVQCEEAADCQGTDAGAGSVCCANGGTPAMVPGCGYYKESPAFTTTTCVGGGACPAGGLQLCSTDAECGSGKTCAPFKALGIQLGFCM